MTRYHFAAIPYNQVRIEDAFWKNRQRVNRSFSLGKQYTMCKQSGRIDALRLQWKSEGQLPPPHIYWDSDVAKWLEAACYACHNQPITGLNTQIDEVAQLFVQAQQPDGYLNSHFTVTNQEQRWTNLRDNHELYCAGHIIEAAIAHHQLTQSNLLLNVAIRLANYIDQVFGPNPGQMRGYCGHPEIELALVRLYRLTRDPRYLELARFFIHERGQQPHWFEMEARASQRADYYEMYQLQAHLPAVQQMDAVGHVVRAMYLYCGMTDIAGLTCDQDLHNACLHLWESVSHRKMYVTGGIGSSWHGERFTADFDLPNERAYCETCASVGLVMWAQRMLLMRADSQYAEIMEQALYNGALAGMSLDGKKFFYQNPLASHGQHHRKEWFGCSCCPSNLSRLLGSLGGYIAMQSEDTLAIHLYIACHLPFSLGNGVQGTLQLIGNTPWQGSLNIKLQLNKASDAFAWTLRLRIPRWSHNFTVRINDTLYTPLPGGHHLDIHRVWSSSDDIHVQYDQPISALQSDPRVLSNAGQIALQRGPFLYCIEDADFPDVDHGVYRISLSSSHLTDLQTMFDISEGIMTLHGRANASVSSTGLYSVLDHTYTPKEVSFRAIPYFAWDNRTPGAMRIWIPYA